MDKNEYIINKDNTIYEALVKIEKNKHRSLIVVDDNNKVVGTLSDGDIRKGLINHILLEAPVNKVMNLNFKMVFQDQLEEISKIFQTYNIFILPVVDSDMNLVDLKVN